MRWDDSEYQRKFFDQSEYQYPEKQIIFPSLAQQFEFFHIKKLAKVKRSDSILDFGCGSGRLTVPLLRNGFDVCAVDISQNSLNTLRSIYNRYKNKTWGKLTTSTKIPADKQFDAIVSSDILHHVVISEFLPKLYHALKPSGILAVSEPNAFHIFWYLYYLFIHPSWAVEKGFIQCSVPNITRELRLAGFKKCQIEGHGLLPTPLFNFVPFLGRLNALILGNNFITRYIAFRLIVYAQK